MRDRITAALKEAMKAKDQTRLSTLRLVTAAIKDREIASRGADEGAKTGDADVIDILARMIKQREESIRAYEEGGRLELAEREQTEIDVIREFLPKPLTKDEAANAITEAIQQTGASSLRDMGAVMGHLKARYAGRMNFGEVGAAVKAQLG